MNPDVASRVRCNLQSGVRHKPRVNSKSSQSPYLGQKPADAARIIAITISVRAQEICFLLQDLLPDSDESPKQQNQRKPSRYEHRVAGQRHEDAEEDWIAAEAVKPRRDEVYPRSFVNAYPPRSAEMELCENQEY
jgi:hypothetical protein